MVPVSDTKIRIEPHFDGHRYFNPGGGRAGSFKDVLRWRFVDRRPGPWGKRRAAVTAVPPPRRVAAGELQVTWVGHSTVLLQVDGVNVLTDPIWSERCSPVSWAGPRRVQPPGIRFEDLPPIDLVLLSHNHYDHCDLPTLRRLVATYRFRLFTSLGNRDFLRKQGIPCDGEMDWWDEAEALPGFGLTAVPARHFSARTPWDRNKTLWTGFVLRAPSGDIYYAGDTGMGPHFDEIHTRFPKLRLAMLPIGAFRPRWMMSRIHVSPAEAWQAHRLLQPQVSMAIHYGTFPLGDDGEKEPVEELRKAMREHDGCASPFWVLSCGEWRLVPPLFQGR